LKAQLSLHRQLMRKEKRIVVESDQNNLRLSFHSTSLLSFFPSCVISYGPPNLLALVPICLKKQICTHRKKIINPRKQGHNSWESIYQICLPSIFFILYFFQYILLFVLFVNFAILKIREKFVFFLVILYTTTIPPII
jgi:hypothetical protein